jgi:hypothetical protein
MVSLPESVTTSIQSMIRKVPFASFEGLGIVAAEGLQTPARSWAGNDQKWTFSEAAASEISWESYENSREAGVGLTSHEIPLHGYFSKLVMSPAQIAGLTSNALNSTSIEAIVANQIHSMGKVIESMVWCGQAGRYLAKPVATTATNYKAKGLMFATNTTTIGGGTGVDDNMSAYGDYYDTCALAEATARSAGLDISKCYVVMDASTWAKMRVARSTNVQEFNEIKIAFPTWKFSASDAFLANGLTSNHYMAFVFPKDTAGQKAIEYVESVPMSASAVGGGTLCEDGTYKWHIGTKFGTDVNVTSAVIKTGSLTL